MIHLILLIANSLFNSGSFLLVIMEKCQKVLNYVQYCLVTYGLQVEFFGYWNLKKFLGIKDLRSGNSWKVYKFSGIFWNSEKFLAINDLVDL